MGTRPGRPRRACASSEPLEQCRALSSLVQEFGEKLNPWTVRTLAHQAVFGRNADARRKQSLLLKVGTSETGPSEELQSTTLHSINRAACEIKSQKRRDRHAILDQELSDIAGLTALLRNDLVASVTVPRPVRPMLHGRKRSAPPNGLRGFTDIRCEPQHFSPEMPALDGASVVMGIVDYGCDYAHPALRDGNGTRLLALWDQNAPAGGFSVDANPFHPFQFDYGKQYERADIQGWLSGTVPSPYDPHASYFTADPEWGAHGTYVASIAAGTPLDNIGIIESRDGSLAPARATSLSFRGVAPASPLIFVQLGITSADWADNVRGSPMFRQYSDIRKLIDAINYIYAKAIELKVRRQQKIDGVVVNLSVGTWGGAHDGHSTAERAIDELVAEVNARPDLPPLAVVVGAGNAGQLWNHDTRTISPGGSADLRWRMMNGDTTPNELEIWYKSADPSQLAQVEIAPPGADLDDPAAPRFVLPPTADVTTLEIGGEPAGFAMHVRGQNGRPNHVDLVVDPRAGATQLDPGNPWVRAVWTLRIKTSAGAGETIAHSWIERDDIDDALISSFQGLVYRLDPYEPVIDPLSTLSSLSCGRETIVVGGYSQARLSPSRTDAWYASSYGPAPWERNGNESMPDISAPAHNVLGAASKTGAFFAQSGTSAAAPHAAGAVALFLQAAARDGWRPTTDDIRRCLQDAARARRQQTMTNWPAGADWDPQRGFGPLDVAGFLAQRPGLS